MTYEQNGLDPADARCVDGPVPDQPLDPEERDPGAPDYPHASRFISAANFSRWRHRERRPVSLIVIHITDGREKISGPIGHFQKQATQASAHYIVGRDGEVVQMVRHDDIAWHASAANRGSIGIEHVARSPLELSKQDPGLPVTDAQYESSARLVRWLCQRYALPVDRAHIKGHCEAVTTTHADCPNRIWDWDRYIALVAAPAQDAQEPPPAPLAPADQPA